MNLQKAKRLVSACLEDPAVKRLYEMGDELSRHQTKHDLDHAFQVMALANQVAAEIHTRSPKMLDEWTREVVIPLAAFLHDIGRAISVEEHDKAGAKWSLDYLQKLSLPDDNETLPLEVVKRICRIIACHRSRVVHKLDFNDHAWAIVVLADKCVGDEERVRPFRAFILSLLTPLRLTWIPLRRDGGVHDRANFAIKRATVKLEDTEIVLNIDLDRRVCSPSLVYELYGDRFYACAKASRFLGFNFRLQFNDEKYEYSKPAGTWLKLKFS